MPRRLRPVNDQAIEDERMARIARAAYLMRQRGMELFDIAESLQVTEDVIKTGTRMTMSKAAAMIAEETATELLAMEVARLNALQNALWDQAMAGDARAVDSVLKVIDRRTDLLGLSGGSKADTHHTVVVTGDTDAYIEALRQIKARREVEA